MVTRNLSKVQEALNELNPVQRNINELKYYKKNLTMPNHSKSLCASVRSTIDTLAAQHAEVVNALILYGSAYQWKDESLAISNNPIYQSQEVCLNFSYINAPEHEKGFWEKTWNQIFLGDFSDDATWLGSGVNIVAAIFGVDAPMDVRDLIANVSKGEWGWAIVSAVSLLPVVGVFGKGGKTVSKGAKALDAATEIIDAGSTTVKHGSNILDAGSIIVKHGSNIVDGSSTIIKQGSNIIDSAYSIGGKTYKTVDGVFSGIKNIDEVAIPFRQGDKLLWITNLSRKYVLSNDTFSIINKFDIIDSSVDGVKYLPDFKYIKKADAELEALRKTFDSSVRADFVKKLATENIDDLKQLNLTDLDIANMKKGNLPTGFEVHHKLSLDDGGDNSFANLILIQDEYHDVFTFYQNTFTKTNKFLDNGYAVVDWVIPTGQVYTPKFTELPLFTWGN